MAVVIKELSNGVTFDEKHSLNDWDLIMVSKQIGEAEPRTTFVEIEGRDGNIDLTEALGEVKYNNRTLNFHFELFNPIDFWKSKQEISNYLNGRKMPIVLDKDKDYYYYGRCRVTAANYERNLGQIDIEAICDPYKMKKEVTSIEKIVQTGDQIYLKNERKTVMPIVKSTGDIVFKFHEKQFSVSSTVNFQSPDFILKEGFNKIEIISGNGTLIFLYREGSL